MGCNCGKKSSVKYQVKAGGQNVGRPVDSVAEAHVKGKATGKPYTFTAVKA